MHLLALPLFLGAAQALLVPPPPGPYSVAIKAFELIDPNRIDPFAPKPNTKRRFMASAYLPVDVCYDCKTQVVPYMPALTASVFGTWGTLLGVPNGTLENFEMDVCDISTIKSDTNVWKKKKEKFPVAVFSPGRGGTRLIYGALARSLASLGYIVITLDHTYETEVVEFPDGSVAYATSNLASSNVTVFLQEVKVRVTDVSFLISQLSNTTLTSSVFANFPGTFNPHQVAVYGHSLGGDTAVAAAKSDTHVIGGLNFDGTIFGPLHEQSIKCKPFLLVESGAHINSPPSELQWDDFYRKLDAAKMRLAVRHTQHYAFTDVPLLLTVDPVPPALQPTIYQSFGTLNGKKVEKAVDEIMAGLLELLFHKNAKPLKNVGRDPNIDVLRSYLPRRK